ncbi:hypothetical protein [Kribbella sp. NPDC003557]|uniref:hypothetical protein n=1 Tax=Kribbella sp. NPDC003557 TaxID=3154449 RepID=UPI0033B0F83C
MVSTVLPDEGELEQRRRELQAGLLRRSQVDWSRVPTREVVLDVALAALPKEQRSVTIKADPVAMADTVADCLSHGWPALLELVRKVEEHRVPSLTELVYAEANAAIYDIVPQLAEVEDLAREIVLQRLKLSEEQVRAARLTFLAGPGVDRAPIGYLRSTRQRLTLRPGPHLTALRSMLADLAPSERMVQWERAAVRSQRDLVRGNPNLSYILDKSVMRLRAFELRRAQRVYEVSQYWPLVAWLVGTDPTIDDDDLLARILDELVTISDAIRSVRSAVHDGGVWATDTITGAQAQAGWQAAGLTIGTTLTNPFTRNMHSPRGPWRYPLMIDAALQELGFLPPSPVAVAASSVTAGSSEYNGLSHLMTGGVLAVSLAAPPVGVPLGVTTALWNLFHDVVDYQDQRDAHRAVLDPASSLAVPPSLRQVEASIVGLVGSAVPGFVPALAFGVTETVMRLRPGTTQ